MHSKRKYVVRSIIILVLAMSMAIAIATTAFAYEILGYIIGSTKTFVPSSVFGSTSKTHMGYAVGKWNTAAESILMKKSSTTHNSSDYYDDDGKNYIYKEDGGTDYVAECWHQQNAFGYLTEFDININSNYDWANSAQPGCYDLYSVFLHETGHAAGLDDLYDSSDSGAVMYGYSYTNTTKRSLSDDDEAGIEYIYNGIGGKCYDK